MRPSTDVDPLAACWVRATLSPLPGKKSGLILRKRILYYYGALHLDTGSPRALIGLVESLDRRRYQPLFLASSVGPLVNRLRELDVEILRGSVEGVTLRRPLAAGRRITAQAVFLARHRVDLVHVNELGWNQDLVLGARLIGRPAVLHIHNTCDLGGRNLNPWAASRVLTVSSAQTEKLGQFDRISHKHSVVPNAIDVERIREGTNIRETLGIPPGAKVIGTVAQLREEKGIRTLVEVAAKIAATHPDVIFLVAGRVVPGKEDFADEMLALCERLNLQNRVRFLGSRDDIPNFLRTIDIFFFPTHGETFGMALVEAMAAGRPVVASRVDAIPEIVGSELNGYLFTPKDAGEAAAALVEILGQDDLGQAMGRRAQASVFGRYDRTAVSRLLTDLYDQLLG